MPVDYYILIFILIFLLILVIKMYLINNFYKPMHKMISYNKIFENLYLGNIDSAKDINFIKKNNIKYIFNISNGIPNYFDSNYQIKYYNLYVADSLLKKDIEIMNNALPYLVNVLDECLEKDDGNILIHCHAGRQRSAILVAAYLVYKFHMTPDEAYNFILEKRPEAFHYGTSYNFHKALENYYNDLYV